MKVKLLILGVVLETAVQGAVYDCAATYYEKNIEVERLEGVFDSMSGNEKSLYLQFQNQRNINLSMQEGQMIKLYMGDFCGGVFHETWFPVDVGETIESTLYYGRDPLMGRTGSLIELRCARRKN